MRLINIDDECLKKTMAVGGISAKALWKRLQREPTVKAIPIEWINSYTTGLIFSDEYINNTDSIDYYIDCIKEMVRDWEKENETNRQG